MKKAYASLAVVGIFAAIMLIQAPGASAWSAKLSNSVQCTNGKSQATFTLDNQTEPEALNVVASNHTDIIPVGTAIVPKKKAKEFYGYVTGTYTLTVSVNWPSDKTVRAYTTTAKEVSGCFVTTTTTLPTTTTTVKQTTTTAVPSTTTSAVPTTTVVPSTTSSTSTTTSSTSIVVETPTTTTLPTTTSSTSTSTTAPGTTTSAPSTSTTVVSATSAVPTSSTPSPSPSGPLSQTAAPKTLAHTGLDTGFFIILGGALLIIGCIILAANHENKNLP